MALERWLRRERPKLSRHAEVAKAIDYLLKRWPAFVRFLDDGRICLSNNAAERSLRGIALGRKSWLFCGSDKGASYCSPHHLIDKLGSSAVVRQAAGVASGAHWLGDGSQLAQDQFAG
jgi:hypothetical protein